MIITISGLPGSGKSTVGKIVARKLGYKFYSIGDIRGKWALERGMTIDELNKLGEKEDWTDREADKYSEKLGKTEDDFVIDSRLSFHFIPHSFKVFLTVEHGVGAKRVSGDKREDEDTGSAKHLNESLKKRMESDVMRYKKYYGLDMMDMKNYDLVLDTSGMTPEEVARKIIAETKKRPE